MPIAVTCSGCSTSFSVKDEYAGKRAKCPKCGEPITIPATAGPADTVKMPPGAFPARPAAKPRPVENEDDRPQSKRRSDDEDEEKPKAKAKRLADAPDEKSKAKRRDDEPKKKKSVLPLILGILAGLVLLCGGGAAAIWFLVIVPAANNATAKLASAFPTTPQGETVTIPKLSPPTDSKPAPARGGEVNAANLAKIKAGMTLAEVQGILGNGKNAVTILDLASALAYQPAKQELNDRWNEKVKLGHVLVWKKEFDSIAAAFSDAPDAGGTVIGVVGCINQSGSEPLKLPNPAAPNPNAKPVDPKTLPYYPETTLTATDLAKNHEKYKEKWVVVKGKVKTDVSSKGDKPAVWADFRLESEGTPLLFIGPPSGDAPPTLKAGTEIEVWGLVTPQLSSDGEVALDGCLCQKPTTDVEATTVMEEALKDSAAAKKKYEHQPLKVSGTVANVFGLIIQGSKTGDKAVQVHCDALDDKVLKLKPGDQVTILTNNLEFSDEFKSCTLRAGRVIAIKR